MHKDIHGFLNTLSTRDPLLLEADGFESSSEARFHLICAAAERFFAPASCRETYRFWSSFPFTGHRSEYWEEICLWLPENPPPDSEAALFYEAQKKESKGEKDAALSLYLQASVTHALAAASVARLGGHKRRLDGWKRYIGRCDGRAVRRLQCLAIMMHYLRITRIDEPQSEEGPNVPISEADWHNGFQAGRLAVLLGSNEAALYMTEILGKAGYSLTLPYLALVSDESIHAAAFLRAVATERQKTKSCIQEGPDIKYVKHVALFEEEGGYMDLPWQGKPFCRVPDPGTFFYKSGKRILDVAEPALRTPVMFFPLRPTQLDIHFDSLRLMYYSPRLFEGERGQQYCTLLMDLRDETPSTIAKFLGATEAEIEEAKDCYVRTPPQLCKGRHACYTLYLGKCRKIDSRAAAQLSQLSEHPVLPLWRRGCLQCDEYFETFDADLYPMPQLSADIVELCDRAIASSEHARRLWKGALLCTVRSVARAGTQSELQNDRCHRPCGVCNKSLRTVCWRDGHSNRACYACMLPRLAGPGGIDLMGFARFLSFTLHMEAKARGILSHAAGVRHWGSWLSFALEYLITAVPTPSITTAQWAQLVARFGSAHMSVMEMLPPMVWLLSQRWFYGEMTSTEAEATLKANSASHGWWLMRYSSSEVGGLAFTVVESDGRTRHYRVSRGTGGEYIVRLKGSDETFAGLREMVAVARKLLPLLHPMEGSKHPVPAPRLLTKETFVIARTNFEAKWHHHWPIASF